MERILIMFGCIILAVESRLLGVRIIGGNQADRYDWPWQVSLQSRLSFSYQSEWSHICGGSLIATDVVLTAAHCTAGQSASTVRVVAGLHRQNDESSAQILTVSEIITHPKYNSSADGFPNDIALLKLDSSVQTKDKTAAVIPLPMESSISFYGNSDCWVTGWGKTNAATSRTSKVLMEVRLDVISNEECSSKWDAVEGAAVLDTHICIGSDGKSVCNGDSGSPLACRVDGEFVLAGVTSWGTSSCEGLPSVCVRVSRFLDWIRGNL